MLISPDGEVTATYDKLHMFDVDLPTGETARESAAYEPGDRAVIAEAAGATLGLTVCYDLRFPALYRALALAGAQIMTIPSAFTRPTGEAHWEVLMRARAIETGSFVLAPAQGGRHEDGRGTWGHSIIVGPWGEIVGELDHDEPGVLLADLDLSAVAKARAAIPALRNARDFTGP
jgi:predicted amidohydrolase